MHSCSRTFCFHRTFFVFLYVQYCSDNSHSNKKFKPVNILLLEVANSNSDRVIFLSHKRLLSPPRQEKSNSHSNVQLYSEKYSSIEMKEIKLHHKKHAISKCAGTILSTHHYLEVGCLKICFAQCTNIWTHGGNTLKYLLRPSCFRSQYQAVEQSYCLESTYQNQLKFQGM